MIPHTASVQAARGRHVVGGAGPAARVVASALLLPPSTLSSARLLYATAGAPGHDYPGHPECAARVPAILEALDTHGLTARTDQVWCRPGSAC